MDETQGSERVTAATEQAGESWGRKLGEQCPYKGATAHARPLLLRASRCCPSGASGVARAPASRGRRVGERWRSDRRTPEGEPVSWPAQGVRAGARGPGGGQVKRVEELLCSPHLPGAHFPSA